jgi:hypothetical protein
VGGFAARTERAQGDYLSEYPLKIPGKLEPVILEFAIVPVRAREIQEIASHFIGMEILSQ